MRYITSKCLAIGQKVGIRLGYYPNQLLRKHTVCLPVKTLVKCLLSIIGPEI